MTVVLIFFTWTGCGSSRPSLQPDAGKKDQGEIDGSEVFDGPLPGDLPADLPLAADLESDQAAPDLPAEEAGRPDAASDLGIDSAHTDLAIDAKAADIGVDANAIDLSVDVNTADIGVDANAIDLSVDVNTADVGVDTTAADLSADAFACKVLTPSAGAASLKNQLVGRFCFDGALAQLGNDCHTSANHLTANGPQQVQGALGKAARFDGSNDYFERTGDADFVVGSQAWTVAVWVKLSASQKGGTLVSWYRCGANPSCTSADSAIYELTLNGTSGKAGWYLRDDSAASKSLQSVKSLADGCWHHVVGLIRPSSTKTTALYVDGVEVASASVAIGAFSTGNVAVPLSLGRHFIRGWGTPSAYFGGELDDVRIYRRALTGAEISALAAGAQ